VLYQGFERALTKMPVHLHQHFPYSPPYYGRLDQFSPSVNDFGAPGACNRTPWAPVSGAAGGRFIKTKPLRTTALAMLRGSACPWKASNTSPNIDREPSRPFMAGEPNDPVTIRPGPCNQSETHLKARPRMKCGRSSGVEHNLAKVGVEGSNPFARSRFSQENKAVKTVLRGRFLLPRPPRESWGSRGEAAESEKQRATGCRRHGGHPKATVFRLRDRRQWVASRSTTKAGFGRHRTSPDAQARPVLLHRRRWRGEWETHRSALPPARRIGSTSRGESGKRTNPCAA
jgi:hypothetical protein